MKVLLPTPSDFDFLECINAHGWKRLLPFSWDEENCVLSRVELFEQSSPVLLQIYGDGDFVAIESDDPFPDADAKRRVLHMLQFDIPMTGFHEYCGQHLRLGHIPALKQGRILRSPTLFEDVIKVIATTNTTWSQTKAMVERIVNSFGTPSSREPSLKAFPTAEQIASASLEEFSDKARMGYRNSSVHKIATAVATGEVNLDSFAETYPTIDELYKELLKLPGIGPYAASCLLIYLGHYNRVNVDSWARTLVSKELGNPVTDKEAHAFFAEYGEWKALVYHFYRWREDGETG